jgi:hypothetical protein
MDGLDRARAELQARGQELGLGQGFDAEAIRRQIEATYLGSEAGRAKAVDLLALLRDHVDVVDAVKAYNEALSASMEVLREADFLAAGGLSGVWAGNATKVVEGLADVFGGFDEVTQAADAFIKGFYSSAEVLAADRQSLARRFAEAGYGGLSLDAPDEFRKAVESLDLSTEAGRSTYKELISLAPEFEDFLDRSKSYREEIKLQTQGLKDFITELTATKGGLASPLDKLKAAKATYMTDLVGAQGGDQDALKRVTTSAGSYIEAQKAVTASSTATADVISRITGDLGALLRRTEQQSAASLLQSSSDSLPAFVSGGLHRGGWAKVGENGEELVNFDQPARIYNASQTRQALSGAPDDDQVVAELRALRATLEAFMAQQSAETSASINANVAAQRRTAEAVASKVADVVGRASWESNNRPTLT